MGEKKTCFISNRIGLVAFPVQFEVYPDICLEPKSNLLIMMSKKNHLSLLFILPAKLRWVCAILLFPLLVNSQTYVGLINTAKGLTYAKISQKDNLWRLSFPTIINAPSYDLPNNPFDRPKQAYYIQDLIDYFTTSVESENALYLTASLPGEIQSKHRFYIQASKTPVSELKKFSGFYKDKHGAVSVVSVQFERLQFISPYSGETLLLKPIGPNTFWATSGALFSFENEQKGAFQQMSRKLGADQIIKAQKIEPFTIEEVWIPHQKDTLYGKLYSPNISEPTPGVLLLQGGGSAGLANYEYEAKFFAANGIAVLLCNKAGEGQSKGPSNFQFQNFDEKIDEYQSLFEYLAGLPNVNSSKVGIHGVSEGGRLALILAAQTGVTPAFVVAGAAPIMTMREGQLYAVQHHHRQLGISESNILEITSIWNAYYEGIIKEKIESSTIERANKLRNLHSRVFLPPNSTSIPGAPLAVDLQSNKVVESLNEIACPILLQYGENDQRVDPYGSIRNLETNKQELEDVNIILYPRANHSYMTPEFQISKGYLMDKLNWLKKINVL